MSRRNLIAICLILVSAVYAKFQLEENLRQAFNLYNEKSNPQAAEQTNKRIAGAKQKAEILEYRMDLISSQQDVLIFLEGSYRLIGLELAYEKHRIEEVSICEGCRKINVYEVEISMNGSAAQIVEFIKSVQMEEACMGFSEMKMTYDEYGGVNCSMLLVLAGNLY